MNKTKNSMAMTKNKKKIEILFLMMKLKVMINKTIHKIGQHKLAKNKKTVIIY
jgi:hypothetical protein